jgi:hypothetical protein
MATTAAAACALATPVRRAPHSMLCMVLLALKQPLQGSSIADMHICSKHAPAAEALQVLAAGQSFQALSRSAEAAAGRWKGPLICTTQPHRKAALHSCTFTWMLTGVQIDGQISDQACLIDS